MSLLVRESHLLRRCRLSGGAGDHRITARWNSDIIDGSREFGVFDGDVSRIMFLSTKGGGVNPRIQGVSGGMAEADEPSSKKDIREVKNVTAITRLNAWVGAWPLPSSAAWHCASGWAFDRPERIADVKL
jgi:hypothetical protein